MKQQIRKLLTIYIQIVGALAAMLAALFTYRVITLGPRDAFAGEYISSLLSWVGLMVAIAFPVAVLILFRESFSGKTRLGND